MQRRIERTASIGGGNIAVQGSQTIDIFRMRLSVTVIRTSQHKKGNTLPITCRRRQHRCPLDTFSEHHDHHVPHKILPVCSKLQGPAAHVSDDRSSPPSSDDRLNCQLSPHQRDNVRPEPVPLEHTRAPGIGSRSTVQNSRRSQISTEEPVLIDPKFGYRTARDTRMAGLSWALMTRRKCLFGSISLTKLYRRDPNKWRPGLAR